MEEKGLTLFIKYLKARRRLMIYLILCIAIWIVMGFLNRYAMENILYIIALWLFFGAIFLGVDYFKFYQKYQRLFHIKEEIKLTSQNLPETEEPLEELYQELLQISVTDKLNQLTRIDREKTDMVEYYSMWVHQIKTPIAGMSLLLQVSDSEDREELRGELFRIEQYVEMVLSYLRLSSETNDFVLKEYAIDKIVNSTVKKFASQFIRKKISLQMEHIEGYALTDEKWLSFVIEQIISNALKYTNEGSITISYADNVLTIADTGIGIEQEDLPRIFENGYTGYNGRKHQKSTGIGLYLCNKTMKKLSGKISVTSQIGVGSQFSITLPSQNREYE